jgi:predicted transcriptional regulator
MILVEIRDALACEVCACEHLLDGHVDFGCASDLMSDVLAFSQAGALLLTGLVTKQTVQTAYIAEIRAIVFVRGKKPDSEVAALAEEKHIPLLATPYSMYEACGILYSKGLTSTMHYVPKAGADAGHKSGPGHG